MPAWFAYLEAALPDCDVEYVFVGDKSDPTRSVIIEEAIKVDRPVHFVDVVEPVKEYKEHWWREDRALWRMVNLRNYLLSEVRELEPDLFLSLDSDILCHPQQITNLIETLEDDRDFAAVGGKVFLTPGRDNPSWCRYSKERGIQRSNIDYVTPVDVIMAIKLMTPEAYRVDYQFSSNGEDIGWSLACRKAGLTLGHDGRVTSKHVMARVDENGVDLITKKDSRCGF